MKRTHRACALCPRDWIEFCSFPEPTTFSLPFPNIHFLWKTNQKVFAMFCSFCGIGDAQDSICDNCVVEKRCKRIICKSTNWGVVVLFQAKYIKLVDKPFQRHGWLWISFCVGNTLYMEYLWFCFSKLLQDDLDKVKDHWNDHKIFKSPYSSVHGVPDVIVYFLPEYHWHEECLVPVP